MNIKEALRKLGEKAAVQSIEPRSRPGILFQPKMPTKIQKLIDKDK